MIKQNITAIVIAKNEADMIANCLETLSWCSEILVIDNGSTDGTDIIAEKLGARVINLKSGDFSKLRNEGLKRSKTDWIIYIDSDERVSPELAKEILVNIEVGENTALAFYRKNILYGSEIKHAGFGQDLVTRVFKRLDLEKWAGEIHESPSFEGERKILQNKLLHLTHRSTEDNLRKSADWTIKEAELLYKAKIPEVKFRTILRKFVMEFIRRAYFKKGYQDGLTGLVEAFVQACNRAFIYIQVWELQKIPSIKERYEQCERKIADAWKANKF